MSQSCLLNFSISICKTSIKSRKLYFPPTVKMYPTWKIVGHLLLLGSAIAVEYSELVGVYVANLTRYLADQEPEPFDCWFYETAEPSQSSILDSIITLNQAAMIPQRILYSTYKVEVLRLPSLLIVNYNKNYPGEMSHFLQSEFGRTVKVIVFYDPRLGDKLNQVRHFFAYFKFANIIFARSDSFEIHQQLAFQKAGNVFNEGPPFGHTWIHSWNLVRGYKKHPIASKCGQSKCWIRLRY